LAQFSSRDSALAGASEMAGRTAQLLALDKQQLEATQRALQRDIAELRARNETLQVSGILHASESSSISNRNTQAEAAHAKGVAEEQAARLIFSSRDQHATSTAQLQRQLETLRAQNESELAALRAQAKVFSFYICHRLASLTFSPL
jgi:hypothetical protein